MTSKKVKIYIDKIKEGREGKSERDKDMTKEEKDAIIASVDWGKEFKEKREVLLERGFEKVSPREFYRDLFPEGSLGAKGSEDSGKGNVIITLLPKHGEKRRNNPRWIVFDDLQGIEKVYGEPFGLIAPISYFGKTHLGKNAHELFAIAIDIDYVRVYHLRNLLKQFREGIQLTPSYLVSSGRGVHLYYFLREPLPMFPERVKIYGELKKALIRRMWNDTVSLFGEDEDKDITGVLQGFRAVGTRTKLEDGTEVEAFRISERRFSLSDIKNAIPECSVNVESVERRKIPIQLAKLLYPEWYKKVEEKKGQSGSGFTQSRKLYDWWKKKMLNEVRSGGRYFSIMALCSFGLKCGVPDREIRKDAYSFLEVFEARTEDEVNHFTRKDINDALRALKADNREKTKHASREWISEATKISIPKNKRNGRTQAEHLELARAARDIDQRKKGATWNGRKSKGHIVQEWRLNNPEGKKADCIRDTGLSKPTVYKYWGAGAAAAPESAPDWRQRLEKVNSISELMALMDTLKGQELAEFTSFLRQHEEEIDGLLAQFKTE